MFLKEAITSMEPLFLQIIILPFLYVTYKDSFKSTPLDDSSDTFSNDAFQGLGPAVIDPEHKYIHIMGELSQPAFSNQV